MRHSSFGIPIRRTNTVKGNESLHDGPITIADEQAQWTACQAKLATNGITIGREAGGAQGRYR
jgi:hypothetical protein